MMSKLTLEGIDLKPLRNCHDEILASRIVSRRDSQLGFPLYSRCQALLIDIQQMPV